MAESCIYVTGKLSTFASLHENVTAGR